MAKDRDEAAWTRLGSLVMTLQTFWVAEDPTCRCLRWYAIGGDDSLGYPSSTGKRAGNDCGPVQSAFGFRRSALVISILHQLVLVRAPLDTEI